MDDQTLRRLQPQAQTTHAIAVAMGAVHDETARVATRQAELRQLRQQMLLNATTSQLRANADEIADCDSDLLQLDAIGKELDRQYSIAKQAELAGERQKQWQECAAAIEKSNAWFHKNYVKHAQAIAEGLALEQIARRLMTDLTRHRPGQPPLPSLPPLPQLAQAHVGSEARDYSALVRLPASEPNTAAYHWVIPPPAPLQEVYHPRAA
jgi:hypothetical protein